MSWPARSAQDQKGDQMGFSAQKFLSLFCGALVMSAAMVFSPTAEAKKKSGITKVSSGAKNIAKFANLDPDPWGAAKRIEKIARASRDKGHQANYVYLSTLAKSLKEKAMKKYDPQENSRYAKGYRYGYERGYQKAQAEAERKLANAPTNPYHDLSPPEEGTAPSYPADNVQAEPGVEAKLPELLEAPEVGFAQNREAKKAPLVQLKTDAKKTPEAAGQITTGWSAQ